MELSPQTGHRSLRTRHSVMTIVCGSRFMDLRGADFSLWLEQPQLKSQAEACAAIHPALRI